MKCSHWFGTFGVVAALVSGTAQAGEGATPMKAMAYHEYGSPDVLRMEEADKPVPGENQVLVKVRAAAVNPLDWHYMLGKPYLMRLQSGFFEPKSPQMGVDMAGVVEAVGPGVTRFKPGDEVFGVVPGAFGEYAKANEKRIALKPAGLSFEDAAAMPVAAVTALQGLRDSGRLAAGQKVLVNGASGGVGTFAVQIAKALGAEVTGVCSGRNAELVRSLGADKVVDYTKDDFTKGTERYDIVLDNVGNHSLSEVRGVLTPKGIHVLIGGGGPDDNPWIGPFGSIVGAKIMSPFVDQEFAFMLAEVNPGDLGVLSQWVGEGKLKSVIDRTYEFDKTPDAVAYVMQGHARGKVVITVAPEPEQQAATESSQ